MGPIEEMFHMVPVHNFNMSFRYHCTWKKYYSGGQGVYHQSKFFQITPFNSRENDTTQVIVEG